MSAPRKRRRRPVESEGDTALSTSGSRRRCSQAPSARSGNAMPSAKEPQRLRTAAELLFADENRLRRICAIAYVLREKFGNEGALREAARRMRIAQERVAPKRRLIAQQLSDAKDDEAAEEAFRRAMDDSEEDFGEILCWYFVGLVLRLAHTPGSVMVS
jgi:hypothetical protein